MVNKKLFARFALLLFSAFLLVPTIALTSLANQPSPNIGSGTGTDITADDYSDQEQKLASIPSECVSEQFDIIDSEGKSTPVAFIPYNCLFLDEPIGGTIGYDLFVETCTTTGSGLSLETICVTSIWSGGSVPASSQSIQVRGPIQAVLTSRPGAEYQGPFGLLYSYLSLVYGYMSGLIVGVVVLYVVIGGIQMSTSGGDQGKFENGKSRIVKAIVGMILWFTASLILYTINPTFFAF